MAEAVKAKEADTLFTVAMKLWLSPDVNINRAWYLLFFVAGIVILGAIIYLSILLVKATSAPPVMTRAAEAQAKRKNGIEADTQLLGDKSLYKDLINNLATGERYLVNLCPLTASLGGYVGAGETGVFYSDIYLQNALRAGIRSFILPISVYADDNKKPPDWPYSGQPAIVARNVEGDIISLNGLSVEQFCKDLVILKKTNLAQLDEPILLFIVEDRGNVPNKVTDEKGYAQLLSSLGRELKVGIGPSENRLTTIGGYGSAVGSQNDANILTQIPLSELKGKILIFTDFDTSIGLKEAYSNFNDTLHTYTNFTIKTRNSSLALTGSNSVRSILLNDVSGSTVNWTDQSRTVIHIASTNYNLAVPNVDAVDGATKKGIQITPVPFYTTEAIADVKPIWDLWKGYSWRVKEPSARYLKPDPVVPAKPSAKMNARVDQNLQPGQMGV